MIGKILSISINIPISFVLVLIIIGIIAIIIYYIHLFIKINTMKWINVFPKGKGSKFIPKHIYQCVPNKYKINPQLRKNIRHIKNINPEWKHTLFDHNDIITFIEQNFSKNIQNAYKKINPKYGAARIDLFRYLLIYKKGGVYLDVKSSMTYPLDHILRHNDEYILSHWTKNCWKNFIPTKKGEFQQWYIISRPKHPFLKAVIKKVVENIYRYSKYEFGVGKEGVIRTTGPVPYTLAILPLLKKYPHRNLEYHRYFGLVYSVLSGDNHQKMISKTHYSKLCIPIINQ